MPPTPRSRAGQTAEKPGGIAVICVAMMLGEGFNEFDGLYLIKLCFANEART